MDESIVSQNKKGAYVIHRSNRHVLNLYRIVYSVQSVNQDDYEKKILDAQFAINYISQGNVSEGNPAFLNMLWGICALAQIDNRLFSSFFRMVNGKLSSFEKHDIVKQYVNSILTLKQEEKEGINDEESSSYDNSSVLKNIKESLQEKDQLIAELQTIYRRLEKDLQEKDRLLEDLQEKDRLLEDLQTKYRHLERSLREKDEFILRLNEKCNHLAEKEKYLEETRASLQCELIKVNNNKWSEERMLLDEKNSELERVSAENERMQSEAYRNEIGKEYLQKIFKGYLKNAKNWSQGRREAEYDWLVQLRRLEGIPQDVTDMIESLTEDKGGESFINENGNCSQNKLDVIISGSKPAGKLVPDSYTPIVPCKRFFLNKWFNKKTYETYSSIFAPAEVKRNSHMLIQVFLHLLEEVEKVKSLALESNKNAKRRGYIPLQCKLKKGDKVDVLLNVYGEKLLMSETKSVVWQGSFTKCSFDYYVSKDIDVDELSCLALLSVNEVPVGEMRFITKVVEQPRLINPEIIAHKYSKVFISYSHDDESKVVFLHKGLELGAVPHFFDRSYLKPGDIFPKVIRDYIKSADLFVLCWSENASKSEYVQKERSYALKCAKPAYAAKLRIYPISIEPRAELPNDMKDYYHFGVI